MHNATSARILKLVCLAIVCLCARVSLAQRAAVYAVTSSGDALRQLDPDGPFEKFGAYPDGVLNCLAADKNNRLFTIHSPMAPAESVLLEINPRSGEFTRIATLSKRLNVRAASFTADGRLVAIALTPGERAGAAPVSTLFQIDTTSGACTRLGQVSSRTADGLCLGYTGQLYGYESNGPGLVLVDDVTGISTRVKDNRHVASPATSIAWSSPESLLAAFSESKSPGSVIEQVFPEDLDANHATPILTHRVTGIECLPSAASACSSRPGWTGTASAGDASVSASVRHVTLRATFEPGQLHSGARELTIETFVSRKGDPPLPLVSPHIETLEIRDQNGVDLMEFVVGYKGAIPPYGSPMRANGIWRDQRSELAPDGEPTTLSLTARGMPAGQVSGLSVLRLRVHALAATQLRQVNFPPDLNAPIFLRKGVEARIKRATTPLWNGSVIAELSIVITDPAAIVGRTWAPVFILDAHCIGVDGKAEPIAFDVKFDHLTLGTAFYRLHAHTRARALSPDEVIRITFITEPQELRIDLTLKDVPL